MPDELSDLRAQLARQTAESSELLRASCVPLIARAEKAEAELARINSMGGKGSAFWKPRALEAEAKWEAHKDAFERDYNRCFRALRKAQADLSDQVLRTRELIADNERHADLLRKAEAERDALRKMMGDSWNCHECGMNHPWPSGPCPDALATPEPAKSDPYPPGKYPMGPHGTPPQPLGFGFKCDGEHGPLAECHRCAPPTPPEKKERP